MKTIVCGFLFHEYLVQREFLNALKKTPGIKCAVFRFPAFPGRESAELLCRKIRETGINILFTVNDFGLDPFDVTGKFLENHRIIHVNWYVDNPFFNEVMYGKKFPPHNTRVDFVSDRTYVPLLNRSGYNASFLPLGVDPGIFLQKRGERTYTDTVSFVGNSYRNKIDKYVAPHYEYFESILPDIRETASAYRQSRNQDLESKVEEVISRNMPPSDLPFRKAVMITSLFIDYLSRKDTIISLAEHFPEFRVYGDTGWTQEIDPSRVSGEIGYYDNLSRKYSETMINIDINRIVIKQGFTQRVFDAPVSGGFLITSYKPVLEEFFEISGPNKEIVCFRDNNDLIDKVNYYMEAEDEREGIRERAAEKILANHTYNHRIGEIFRRLKQVF